MQKTVIVTDTDSSLSPEMAAEFGILQVPIGINFADETYTAGLDIDDRLLFEIIDRKKQLPTTSAPNPEAFVSAFKKAFSLGAQSIVCVCVSGQVSSTYQSAVKACGSFPDREIHIIDSNNLSMAQGFMAMAAAEAASRDASLNEIVSITNETGKKVHTFAVLATLKYLYMGGRVSKFQAGLADSLNIKPTLTVKDGTLTMLEKNRTQKKAIERILLHLSKIAKETKFERMAVIHVNEAQGASAMEAVLRQTLPCPEVINIVELAPGLSVHTGSGMVGVVVQTE
jgi:DegV family protein with EDD domain